MLSEASQTHNSDSTWHPEHSGHTARESGSRQGRQRPGRQTGAGETETGRADRQGPERQTGAGETDRQARQTDRGRGDR